MSKTRVLLVFALGALVHNTLALASDWVAGDVFAAVGAGQYKVYSNAGVFKETITDPNADGFTTGCAIDPAGALLYTTNFFGNNVHVFNVAHPHANVDTITTSAEGAAGSALPESIVFRADGGFFVGHAGGDADIHRYTSGRVFAQQYNVTTQDIGSDWIELAADQQTIFYTSEGSTIFRFDTGGGGQLTAFSTGVLTEGFALRLLAPGDGSGGLMVANAADIKRLNSAGSVAQSYDATGEEEWFALSLDPNGTSFWSGSFNTDNFYRFNITTGAIEVGPINVGTTGNNLFGLCVLGEITVAQPTTTPTVGATTTAGPTSTRTPTATATPSVSAPGAPGIPLLSRSGVAILALALVAVGVGVLARRR